MPTENRNLELTITLEQLQNSIRNEENSGFLLRNMSITKGGEANQLIVEEGAPPVSQMVVQELIGAETEAEATKLARKLHDELPVDAGVVAFGKLSIESKLVWLAAFRRAGMGVEPPDAGTEKAGLTGVIVSKADEEWVFFGRQEVDVNGKQVREGKKEFSDDGSERVAKYWLLGTGNPNLSGKDRTQPWSAAFISYLMASSGVGKRFLRSEAHQVYIYAAIKAQEERSTDYGYWGFPLEKEKPKVGDLICAWRPTKDSPGPVTFKMAKDGKEYASHCDLVVAVTADSIAVIGGNVDQSVTKRHFKLDDGFLRAANFPKGFALLQNKLAGVEAPDLVKEPKPVIAPDAGTFQHCSRGWEITGYYTPVEKDYSGAAHFVAVVGVGEEAFVEDFLKDVKIEGWGRTRFGWYLGFFSDAYHKAAFAQDALGQPLVIGSVAVDRNEIPFKRQLTLPDLPNDWGKAIYTATDVGGAINQKHIDVYCGEGVAAEKLTKKLTIKKNAKFPQLGQVCFA
ncbi:MAG: lysozyme-like protein [Chthoniobacteraceae bacterium]|nr:lysozyme-like protein [Chthoniobacteraceae bacterium]